MSKFDLAGKRVWVAGHRGMVGSAIVRRLQSERCEVLTAGRRDVDLRRQADVEKWTSRNKPDVVFVAAAATGQLRRIATTYSITDRRLTIETGLLSRDLHQTRLERIQNVNARQSMFERALGIGTVDFDTAGEARFDFAFIGVGEPRRIVRTVDGALHALRGERPVPASDV